MCCGGKLEENNLSGIVLTLNVSFVISQARLPEARVVYCSATGASEPRNMGYMVRLGLWGPGTSFIDFRDFLGAIFSYLTCFLFK